MHLDLSQTTTRFEITKGTQKKAIERLASYPMGVAT